MSDREQLTFKFLQEFISTFEASLDPRVWAGLIREEMKELQEELDREPISRVKLLKELTDLMYVTIGFNMVAKGPEQLGLFCDREHAELMTMLTESQQTYDKAIDTLGDVDYMEAFRRVHNSNMSKLGEDGKPIRREDGKILKGPNYREPKLDDLALLVIV